MYIKAEIAGTPTHLEPIHFVNIIVSVCGHEVCKGRICLRSLDGWWVPNKDGYMSQELIAFIADSIHDAAHIERAVLHTGITRLYEIENLTLGLTWLISSRIRQKDQNELLHIRNSKSPVERLPCRTKFHPNRPRNRAYRTREGNLAKNH